MGKVVFDPVAVIAEERDAVRNFIDVLRREQDALQQADASVLLPLAAEKAHKAQQVAELIRARNEWLATLGYPQDRNGVERGLEVYPAAAGTWQELVQLAETANQMNQINGVLVNQRLRYNQQRLSALRDADQGIHNSGLYGSDGQPQAFSAGRRLGEI